MTDGSPFSQMLLEEIRKLDSGITRMLLNARELAQAHIRNTKK